MYVIEGLDKTISGSPCLLELVMMQCIHVLKIKPVQHKVHILLLIHIYFELNQKLGKSLRKIFGNGLPNFNRLSNLMKPLLKVGAVGLLL